MKTADHKETVATNHLSTVITHRELSIGQAIEQAKADTTKPSAEQSLVESSLPGHSLNQGVSQLASRFHDASATDPKGGDHAGSSSSGLVTPADGLRNSVQTIFDPANHDPSKKDDLHDDWMRPGRPSEADLRAQLGLPGGGTQTDPHDHTQKGSTGLAGHLGRPDGPPGSDPATSHDAHHSQLESMFADEKAGTAPVTVKYDDEGLHTTIDGSKAAKDHPDLARAGGQGSVSFGPKADAARAAKQDEDDSAGRTHPASGGSSSNSNAPKQDHTSEDGQHAVHYNADGSTTVNNYSNHTTTTLHKDGSSDTTPIDDNGNKTGKTTHTPAPGIPDEDHQSTLSEPLQQQVNQMLRDAIKSMHIPSHDGDTINVAGTDIPGTVSMSEVTGPVGDTKGRLLGGDRGSVEGAQDGGGSGPGNTNYNNPQNGAIDFGPDHDSGVQTNGREERDTHHQIKTDPTASGNGGGQHTGGQQSNGGDHGSTAGKPVETTAQHAARELQNAVEHNGSNHLGGTTKGAESVGGAHGVQDPGPAHGGIAGTNDPNGAFADLIRLAENPARSGLAPPAPSATHDTTAVLHFSELGDPAGHLPHGVDSMHVPTSPVFAGHDDHSQAGVDPHHAATSPVFDHIHVPH